MDVARAQYIHFTGGSISAGEPCRGRKWIVEDADPISCIQYYRDGVLSVSEWLAGYSGIREGAWFAADDLRPFLRMCALFSVRPFRKVFRMGQRLFKHPDGTARDHANTVGRRTAKGEQLL
jgi:hypothetical protein